MAKFKMKGFSATRAIGAVGGGMVVNFVHDMLPSDNAYVPLAIEAVAGAGASMLGGEIMGGLGDGILGVVGYKLADQLFNTAPATSGVGLLASQNAIGARQWVASRTAQPVEKVANNNVQ